jgi:hypothetical protein
MTNKAHIKKAKITQDALIIYEPFLSPASRVYLSAYLGSRASVFRAKEHTTRCVMSTDSLAAPTGRQSCSILLSCTITDRRPRQEQQQWNKWCEVAGYLSATTLEYIWGNIAGFIVEYIWAAYICSEGAHSGTCMWSNVRSCNTISIRNGSLIFYIHNGWL